MKRQPVAIYGRIFFGAFVFIAIGVQFIDSVAKGSNIANFFSFFTIQSNILAASILLITGFGTLVRKKETPGFAFVRGAATLYMIMTGIIFALLLSGLTHALQTTIPWVNMILHYLMPIVMIADWLRYPPATRIRFEKALWWFTYPLLYLIYSLVRGNWVHWYPYPFINPAMNGWPKVLLTCAIIAAGIVVIIKLMTLRSGTPSGNRA